MKRLLHSLPSLLIAVYGAAITLFLLVRWLIGEPTVVDLVNRFVPLLLMPALALLPLCLLGRQARLALLMTPAVWTFGVYFLPLFLPNSQPSADAPRLIVASYNIGARTSGLEALVDNIRALDADIIGLQEVGQEAAAYITEALAGQYPYMGLHPRSRPYQGTGILSKLPILDDYAYTYMYGAVFGRLRLQRAVIDFNGVPLTVFDFHAQPVIENWRPPDVMVRRRQVWRLLDEAALMNGPRILIGDFNLNEQSVEYRRIREHYYDAFYEAGWGMGFTNPVWADLETPPVSPVILKLIPPHRRIDFVFYDEAFQAVRAEVWPEPGGSDHLPLLVELAYPGAVGVQRADGRLHP
jgi:endonuclease/exonuclease/phosphatase (EEP) superfamily protein YafD